MSKFDRMLLWIGRIISLPLASVCFYFVWQIWYEWKVSNALAFTAFIASGVFCLVYFFVLLDVKELK
jgi:hypothetical protein